MDNKEITNHTKKQLSFIKSLNKAYNYKNKDLGVMLHHKFIGTSYEKIANTKIYINTVYDLNKKIIYSIKRALDYANSYYYLENNISCSKEIKTYYYIENAVFRIISLWDVLAQILNLYYGLNYKHSEVKYKEIIKTIKKEHFSEEIVKVEEYINEDFDFSDIKIGNHKFINDYRNKLIHRHSPNINTFSYIDIEYKMPPFYLIQRLTLEFCEINNCLSYYISCFYNWELTKIDSIRDIFIDIKSD